MRTLIPFIFLAVMGYVGWYYWQVYTDRPLNETLLLATEESLTEIRVAAEAEEFRMFRTEEFGWVVKRGGLEIYDQSPRVEELVGLLVSLQTDSVMRQPPAAAGVSVDLMSGGDSRESINFQFQPGGLLLARIAATGDVFALPARFGRPLESLLSFGTYRSKRLLKAAPESIDSIRLDYHDSLLWRPAPAEVALLSQACIAPAAAPYADYFDEIADREKYYATLKLYIDGKPNRIEIYRDSLWPRPYVLVGEDYPRTYLAVDSLPLRLLSQ
jgi:hypothetical protein